MITRSRLQEILDQLWDEAIVPLDLTEMKRTELQEFFSAAEEAILKGRES